MSGFDIASMPVKTRLATVFFGLTFMLKFAAAAFTFSGLRTVGWITITSAVITIIISIILAAQQMKTIEKPPSRSEFERWKKYFEEEQRNNIVKEFT